MARLTLDELVHEVALHTGMLDAGAPGTSELRPEPRAEPTAAVQLICARLAAELPTLDRDALARLLPFELARVPAEGDLFETVARELHLPIGAAIELTEVVLRVLGANVANIDGALRVRLERHLPPKLSAHLRGRPPSAPPPRSAVLAAEPAPPRHTLSSGRMGSSRPLSEASQEVSPVSTHRNSVAANPDPHADTRLSSARR